MNAQISNSAGLPELQTLVRSELKGIHSKETGIQNAQQKIAAAIMQAVESGYILNDERKVTKKDLHAIWEHDQKFKEHNADLINSTKKCIRSMFTEARPNKEGTPDAGELKSKLNDHNAMISRFNRAFNLACALAYWDYSYMDFKSATDNEKGTHFFHVSVKDMVGKNELLSHREEGARVFLDNKTNILVKETKKDGTEVYGSIRSSVDEYIRANKNPKNTSSSKTDIEKAFKKLDMLASREEAQFRNTVKAYEGQARSIFLMLSKCFDANGNTIPEQQEPARKTG